MEVHVRTLESDWLGKMRGTPLVKTFAPKYIPPLAPITIQEIAIGVGEAHVQARVGVVGSVKT